MSAFLVSDNHINTLVTFARLHQIQFFLNNGKMLSGRDPQKLAEILKAENVRSLNYRYTEQEEAEPIQFRLTNTYFTPVQILGAANCYEYQACECPDYFKSYAAKIISIIKEEAIRCLPGYADCIHAIP